MEITYDLYGVISVTRFAESPPCVPDDAESCCVLRRGGEAGPAREDCDWLKLNWSSSICSSCNKGPRVPVLGKGIEGRGRSVSSSNSSTMAARRDILFLVVVVELRNYCTLVVGRDDLDVLGISSHERRIEQPRIRTSA